MNETKQNCQLKYTKIAIKILSNLTTMTDFQSTVKSVKNCLRAITNPQRICQSPSNVIKSCRQFLELQLRHAIIAS